MFSLWPHSHILHLWAKKLPEALWSEQERWIYWLPVALACGIWTYFSLPFEPLFALTLSLLFLSLLAVWGAHRYHRFYLRLVFMALLAFSLGFAAAQGRTIFLKSPLLERTVRVAEVEGIVDAIEDRGQQGTRLLLKVERISKIEEADKPLKIRLTWRTPENAASLLGTKIRVLVSLLPPMPPSSPDDYDFRRQAYFDQIGAHGMVLRPPEIITPAPPRWWNAEKWREQTAATIMQHIKGAEGAIAVALVTGERGAIDEQTNENMRRAGTAHLLSISGMHIGMMGIFAFMLVRALLALSVRLALYWPIKSIAAMAGLLAVVAYTLLVGAPVPAVRSMLMSGLVYVAIVARRRALSMRSVALAVSSILICAPENLLSASFQMSFAAIVALIAAYEYWGERQQRLAAEEAWAQKKELFEKIWGYIGGIVATSLIAGIATLPYGAWNFNRLQLFGLLGNLIAVPVTGFVVMPAVAMSYFLFPLGWEKPALWVMHIGLSVVTESAAWIAALPSADIVVARFHPATIALITLSGLWLCLWQTRLRLFALPFLCLGFGLIFMPVEKPLALLSSEGKIIIYGQDGSYYTATNTSTARPNRVLSGWSRAYNQGAKIENWYNDAAAQKSGIFCDALGCAVPHLHLSIPQRGQALEEDCKKAEIILLPTLYAPANCAAQVIDRRFLKHHGATAIYANSVVRVSKTEHLRPWQE